MIKLKNLWKIVSVIMAMSVMLIACDTESKDNEEKEILGKLQMKDGGFDITWKWYTPYPEFEQARAWWRPRITIEKLLFNEV